MHVSRIINIPGMFFLLIIDAIRDVFLVSPLAFILGGWNVQSIHQHAAVAKEEGKSLVTSEK